MLCPLSSESRMLLSDSQGRDSPHLLGALVQRGRFCKEALSWLVVMESHGYLAVEHWIWCKYIVIHYVLGLDGKVWAPGLSCTWTEYVAPRFIITNWCTWEIHSRTPVCFMHWDGSHTQESKASLEGPMLNSLLILFACNSTDLSELLPLRSRISLSMSYTEYIV